MRVAALYDVHGNLPALEAVLAEVEREGFDLVVVGGWLELGPELRHRRTEYDVEAAAAALAEIAWPGPLEAADLLAPASADEAIAVFEAQRASSPPPG